jgi:hypothetical protein
MTVKNCRKLEARDRKFNTLGSRLAAYPQPLNTSYFFFVALRSKQQNKIPPEALRAALHHIPRMFLLLVTSGVFVFISLPPSFVVSHLFLRNSRGCIGALVLYIW